MAKMRLGVIDYIDSAHYLPGHGKCGRVHGHTYKIEVVVEGEVRENGMVIDFYDLKKGIKETLQEYDHTSVKRNHRIPQFRIPLPAYPLPPPGKVRLSS